MFEISNISSAANVFSAFSESGKGSYIAGQEMENKKRFFDDSLEISGKGKATADNADKLKNTQDEKQKGELSEEEKKVVEALKQRDDEVRRHEQAHLSAGAGLVRGGASYSYQVGPDGKQYAIGGEVQIDISPEKDPAATIRKMQQVRNTALAPSDPSGQDRAVAAMASRIEAQAAQELREEKMNESQEALAQVSANKLSNISPQAKLALVAYRKSEEQ